MDEITKEEFDRYETVRESGHFNMIMDAAAAMAYTGLHRGIYMKIIKNYAKLKEEFYGD